MTAVLDACALIAALRGETGGEFVNSSILDQNNTCIVHAINLCEVYYDLARRAGKERAKDVVGRVIAAGVTVREDMDVDFWQEVGNIKADHARVALADCVCITLANRLGVDVWTCDRREYEPIVEKGLCKVRFIR